MARFRPRVPERGFQYRIMINLFRQRTLAKTARCSGVGVHSGRRVDVIIRPAPINHGIKFVRTDLLNHPEISAHFNMVVDTSQATVIGSDGFIVSTIEHLMAAFAGLGIDNARVELNGHEMPIMDGSAGPFAELLLSTGVREQEGTRCLFVVKAPIEIEENGKFVGIYPWPNLRISCTIEYPHPLIRNQSIDLDITADTFAAEIAPARTFGFLHEYEYMKHYGLAQGASLDNVVVIDEDSVLNPGGLRYPDEFIRHKILDCLGDFSLLGMPVVGHIKAVKSGHAFNHAFLRTFFDRRDAWDTVSSCPAAINACDFGKQLAISS